MEKAPRRKQMYEMIVYGGLRKEEYHRIQPAMREKNYQTAQLSAMFGCALLAVLYAISLLIPYIAPNGPTYAFFSLLFAVLAAAVNILAGRDKALTLPLSYAILLVAFAFGIVLGTYLKNTQPATTFCVLMFALPLLITDIPSRSSLLVVVATVAFCICSSAFKSAELALEDRINSLCFLSLGIAINYHVTHTKLCDILNRSIIERERDTDSLTDLLGGAAARRRIADYLAKRGKQGAFLMLDIDDFKHFNDTYGHAYGDSVLRITGDGMREAFRLTDILSRMGGDEFVLFLPGMCERNQIDDSLRRLMKTLRRSDDADDPMRLLSVSAGVAFYPDDGTTFDQLYVAADRALYAAKDAGKNRVGYAADADSPPERILAS